MFTLFFQLLLYTLILLLSLYFLSWRLMFLIAIIPWLHLLFTLSHLLYLLYMFHLLCLSHLFLSIIVLNVTGIVIVLLSRWLMAHILKQIDWFDFYAWVEGLGGLLRGAEGGFVQGRSAWSTVGEGVLLLAAICWDLTLPHLYYFILTSIR